MALRPSSFRRQLTEEDRDRRWQIIQEVLGVLGDDEALQNVSYERLYRTAYEIVTGGQAPFLYNKTREALEILASNATRAILALPDPTDPHTRRTAQAQWANNTTQMAHTISPPKDSEVPQLTGGSSGLGSASPSIVTRPVLSSSEEQAGSSGSECLQSSFVPASAEDSPSIIPNAGCRRVLGIPPDDKAGDPGAALSPGPAASTDLLAVFTIGAVGQFIQYRKAAKRLADFLLYLDKNYCQPKGQPEVVAMAGTVFRIEVFEKSTAGDRVARSLGLWANRLRAAADWDTARQLTPCQALEAFTQICRNLEIRPRPQLRGSSQIWTGTGGSGSATVSGSCFGRSANIVVGSGGSYSAAHSLHPFSFAGGGGGGGIHKDSHMCPNLEFFATLILGPFIEESAMFFAKEAEKWKRQCQPVNWLSKVYRRLSREPLVLQAIGLRDEASHRRLKSLIVSHYVDQGFSTMIQSEQLNLKNLLLNGDVQSIQQLYVICEGSSKCKLSQACQDALEEMLLSIINDYSIDAITAVTEVTKLRQLHARFIRDGFMGDEQFAGTMKKAIASCSAMTPLLSRRLAMAVNDHLRRPPLGQGATGSPQSAIFPETRMVDFLKTHILEPFRCLQDHDIFEYDYRRQIITRVLDTLSRRFVDSSTSGAASGLGGGTIGSGGGGDSGDTWGLQSRELERKTLHMFLDVCGQAYTKKVQGFFEDIDFSREFDIEHQRQILAVDPLQRSAEGKLIGRIRAIVIAASQWVESVADCVSIPAVVCSSVDEWRVHYSAHYSAKFEHRQLTWLLDRGKAVVRFFPHGCPRGAVTSLGGGIEEKTEIDPNSRELPASSSPPDAETSSAAGRIPKGASPEWVDVICSTMQMAILMGFNKHRSWTWIDMARQLGLAENSRHFEFGRRHFLGLFAKNDVEILCLQDASKRKKDVCDSDIFVPNFAIPLDRRKLVAPLVAVRSPTSSQTGSPSGSGDPTASNGPRGIGLASSAGSATDTSGSPQSPSGGVGGMSSSSVGVPAAVEADRKQLVESCIVRLMKQRKSMSYNELIAEIIQMVQARFLPSPKFIKLRIQELIQKEFLVRDANTHDRYNYCA